MEHTMVTHLAWQAPAVTEGPQSLHSQCTCSESQ